MYEIWRRLRRRYVRPFLGRFQSWRSGTYGGIRVHYKRHLDGGGSGFGQDFIPFLRGRGIPKQARAFEWCAGPGFIGFSLLGHGLCETLCLADINPLRQPERYSAVRALGSRGQQSAALRQ
jgi:hypothetical protein